MEYSTAICREQCKYYPFGVWRNSQGTLDTDKLFTGQRLDDTGLYYYNARYYDATIGRFISADTIVQDITNPQTLNRYSYCLNNPLKYIDPSGHWSWGWLKTLAKVAVGVLTVVGIGVAIAAAATVVGVIVNAAITVTQVVVGVIATEVTAGGIVGLLHAAEILAPIAVMAAASSPLIQPPGAQDNSPDGSQGVASSGFKSDLQGLGGWVWTGPDVIDANGIGYTFDEWMSGSGGISTWTGGWVWTGPDVIDSYGNGYTFDEWNALHGTGGSGSGSGSNSGAGDGPGVGGSNPSDT